MSRSKFLLRALAFRGAHDRKQPSDGQFAWEDGVFNLGPEPRTAQCACGCDCGTFIEPTDARVPVAVGNLTAAEVAQLTGLSGAHAELLAGHLFTHRPRSQGWAGCSAALVDFTTAQRRASSRPTTTSMADCSDLHNHRYAWPTAGWHSEDAGRTAPGAAEQEGGGELGRAG